MGEELLRLLTDFGLPTALLFGLAAYHIKIIRQKDAEIVRLNEARIGERNEATNQLLGIVSDFNSLQDESNKTLALLADNDTRRPRR